MSIDLARRLSHLDIRGLRFSEDALLDGGLELTMRETSQLTLVLHDARQLVINAPGAARGQQMAWGPLDFTITGRRHWSNGGVLCTQITARTRGAQALKAPVDDKGQVWSGASPTDVLRHVAGGLCMTVVAEETPSKGGVRRQGRKKSQKAETLWEMFQRYAGKNRFIMSEIGNTVFFARPSWLAARPGFAVSGKGDYLLDHPDLADTSDDPDNPVTINLRVAGEDPAEVLTPCTAVPLTDVPKGFQDRFLVDKASIPFTEPIGATITLSSPVDPEKTT